MSDTPRTDGNAGIVTNAIGEQLEAVPASIARELERELRKEQDQSMMAGSQLSALRLQLKDSEELRKRALACQNDLRAQVNELSTPRPEEKAIALLRAWVAGCGDEHFSTKEQCRELLKQSGDYLASRSPQKGDA